jgi:hypothetical protein
MFDMNRKQICVLIAALLMSTAAIDISAGPAATPQTTAFSYQGQLNAGGSIPTGQYQFTFTLYNAAEGGTQVGPALEQNIQVINGLFTTDLDFGQIFNGTQYWLDIQVGTTTLNEEELSARQPINAVPVAQYALNSPAGKAGLVFAANVQNPFNGESFFFPPSGSGDTTVGGHWEDFDQVAVPMPVACTFDTLNLYLSAVPQGLGGGGPVTVTLYLNGASTGLVAAADNTDGPVSASINGSVTVAAGDLIALDADGDGVTEDGQGMISTSLHCL